MSLTSDGYPLGDLVVVDLSRNYPGPLTARLLADLGARVIKVEEPELGDPARLAPPRRHGVGTLSALLLGGVESVALNLKKPAAQEALRRLLARADVLLETFRPGTLARLGFEPAELRRQFPRLVICSLSGFGQEGPYAQRAGHDITYQALSGAMASNPEQPPSLPVADVAGAWSAACSILAALYRRRETGEGTWIDTSLFDAAVHANLVHWAALPSAHLVGLSEPAGTEREPVNGTGLGEPGLLTGALSCYGVYTTADGKPFALAALEPHFWQRFCRAAGRKDLERRHLSRDPETRAEVAALLASRTRADWRQLCEEHDIPAEPVLTPAEAAAHPQLAARDLLRSDPGGRPRLAFPARFDGTRPHVAEDYPELGMHTDAVMAELGLRTARRSGIGRRRWSLRRWLARWWVR